MIKNHRMYQLINFALSGIRPVIAILLALLISGGMVAIKGANPLLAYAALIKGAVGSVDGLANTAVRATPLILGGLSFSIAYQAGFFNVGVEGQMYIGALAATVLAILPLPIPSWLHILFTLLAAAAGGAIWAAIPAFLRAYRGISEIVVTIMLNFVAIYLVSYTVTTGGPLAKPDAFFPQSPVISKSAELPILLKGSSLHAGFLIGILFCIITFLVLKFTTLGFRTRMVGANPSAAQYSGVNVKNHAFWIMILAGAVGGIAGAGEILGLRHALFDSFSGGLGYDGIAVGILANANPIGVIVSAIFFGGLRAGAALMQQQVGVETALTQIIQALAIFFLMGIGITRKTPYFHRDEEVKQEKGVVLKQGVNNEEVAKSNGG